MYPDIVVQLFSGVNQMQNLKLVYKLSTGFILIIAVMIILALSNGFANSRIEDNALDQSEIFIPVVSNLNQLTNNFTTVRTRFLLYGTEEKMQYMQDGLNHLKIVKKNLATLINLIGNHPELKKQQDPIERFVQLLDNYETTYRNLRKKQDKTVLTQAEETGDEIIKLCNVMTEKATKRLNEMAVSSVQITKSAQTSNIVGVGLGVFLSMIISFFLTSSVKKPIIQCASFADKLAEGDFTIKIGMDRKDEAGQLAASMDRIVENVGSMIGDITTGVETLASSATELTTISEQMASGAEQTTARAETVATAAEEMSANMNTVAAATEEAVTNVSIVATSTDELTSAISEIAQNTAKANQITSTAVGDVEDASEKVGKLGDAATEVGKVTETITEISDQTNLLALNATIEAARAGEAGKGFAVVANEIKDLAKQTAEATGEIRYRINSIQESTQGTVDQISQISSVIKEINGIVSTIAAAVEEQSATTEEISNNMNQATLGLQEVTENVAQSSSVSGEIAQDILKVNSEAGEMTEASGQVRLSIQELSKLAEELRAISTNFRVDDKR
ncbi:hypothetical protein DGMP_28470 [Desulfomarina profundi]|uniref:Methyl-accepting chemotaxis protein n=1 Tax=Desulfomarina profundi TaxID=2772557 RepID=A0A8D5FUY2_9BACT|nr:methyl-accepting chemotaxis protein [Desulfomarina profundi]BCL62154.1 hypothetical protein DGMP_28470 [Desulfomarina profundi]